MLPRLRLVLATIVATIVMVVLGFTQLVKLQVAHDQTQSLAPVEARFAGLAFAARADWAPTAHPGPRSLESLPPFGRIAPERPQAGEDAATERHAVAPPLTRLAALTPPQAGRASSRAYPEAAELVLATISSVPPEIPSTVGPEPGTPAAGTAADAEPTVEVLFQPTALGAAIPADTVPGQIEAAASAGTAEPNTVRLPAPRPAVAPVTQPKTQPRTANPKAARTTARRRRQPAKPPQASSPPSDPLAALFGGTATGNTRN